MLPRSTDTFPDAVAAFVSLAWLGMLLGVSFLATSIKFQASSLELAVALEVRRVTFNIFSKIEWGLALLLVIATFFPRAPRAEMVFTSAAVVIVSIQAFWLRPVLDVRVEAVISGEPLPPSLHQMAYAVLEALKAVALVASAFVALFRLGWRDHPENVQCSA